MVFIAAGHNRITDKTFCGIVICSIVIVSVRANIDNVLWSFEDTVAGIRCGGSMNCFLKLDIEKATKLVTTVTAEFHTDLTVVRLLY